MRSLLFLIIIQKVTPAILVSGQTLRQLRELFQATVATKPQRSQCFFTTVPVLVSKIIWCRYNFPEIKSPEVKLLECRVSETVIYS